MEAKETALREITNAVDAGLTLEARNEAYKNIQLDTYNLQTKKAFDQMIMAGDFEKAAEFLGQQTAREIMGMYGRANHPWGWGTNVGRLVTQFGTWTSNAIGAVAGGVSRGGTRAQRTAYMTRFAMTQAGLKLAGDLTGINISRWLLLPGLFFTGGPAFQTGLSAAQLIAYAFGGGNENDADTAADRLSRLFPGLIRVRGNIGLMPPNIDFQFKVRTPQNMDPRSVFIPFS